MKLFNEYGISFEYPDDWELAKQVDEEHGEIQISVSSEESSFWLISLYMVDIPLRNYSTVHWKSFGKNTKKSMSIKPTLSWPGKPAWHAIWNLSVLN